MVETSLVKKKNGSISRKQEEGKSGQSNYEKTIRKTFQLRITTKQKHNIELNMIGQASAEHIL